MGGLLIIAAGLIQVLLAFIIEVDDEKRRSKKPNMSSGFVRQRQRGAVALLDRGNDLIFLYFFHP